MRPAGSHEPEDLRDGRYRRKRVLGRVRLPPSEVRHYGNQVPAPEPPAGPKRPPHRSQTRRIGEIQHREQPERYNDGHARVVEHRPESNGGDRENEIPPPARKRVPDQPIECDDVGDDGRETVDRGCPPDEGDAQQSRCAGDGGQSDGPEPGSEQQFEEPVEHEDRQRIETYGDDNDQHSRDRVSRGKDVVRKYQTGHDASEDATDQACGSASAHSREFEEVIVVLEEPGRCDQKGHERDQRGADAEHGQPDPLARCGRCLEVRRSVDGRRRGLRWKRWGRDRHAPIVPSDPSDLGAPVDAIGAD